VEWQSTAGHGVDAGVVAVVVGGGAGVVVGVVGFGVVVDVVVVVLSVVVPATRVASGFYEHDVEPFLL